jgi:hypothetical protein
MSLQEPAPVLAARQAFKPGDCTTVEGSAPTRHFGAVFADNGGTARLCGLDASRTFQPIFAALRIDGVDQVADNDEESAFR